MGGLLNGLLRHLFRLRVKGQRDFAGSDFIQRGLFYFFFVKAVAFFQGGQFVVVNAVEKPFVVAFKPFVLANHRSGPQQNIQRFVEIFLGFVHETGFETFLATKKARLGTCDKALDGVNERLLNQRQHRLGRSVG